MTKKKELDFTKDEIKRSIFYFRKTLVEDGNAPSDWDVFCAFVFFLAFVGQHVTKYHILTDADFFSVIDYVEEDLLEYFDISEFNKKTLDLSAAAALKFLKAHEGNLEEAAQAHFRAFSDKLSVTELAFLACALALCHVFPYSLMDVRGI